MRCAGWKRDGLKYSKCLEFHARSLITRDGKVSLRDKKDDEKCARRRLGEEPRHHPSRCSLAPFLSRRRRRTRLVLLICWLYGAKRIKTFAE